MVSKENVFVDIIHCCESLKDAGVKPIFTTLIGTASRGEARPIKEDDPENDPSDVDLFILIKEDDAFGYGKTLSKSTLFVDTPDGQIKIKRYVFKTPSKSGKLMPTEAHIMSDEDLKKYLKYKDECTAAHPTESSFIDTAVQGIVISGNKRDWLADFENRT